MKLNQEQIDNLFLFTKQHYVYWYDLQCELVDHLIHDIEKMMVKDQSLTFVQAKDKAFKKFGVFGFMEVVEAKQKQLHKKYWRMVWMEFKLFFTVPKIILTTLFFLFNYTLFKFHNNYINLIYIGLLTVFVVVFPSIKMYKNNKELKQKIEKGKKKLMAHDLIANIGSIGGFIQLPIQFLLHVGGRSNDTLSEYAFVYALIITIFVLITYISIFIIPKQINKKIANQDPVFL